MATLENAAQPSFIDDPVQTTVVTHTHSFPGTPTPPSYAATLLAKNDDAGDKEPGAASDDVSLVQGKNSTVSSSRTSSTRSSISGSRSTPSPTSIRSSRSPCTDYPDHHLRSLKNHNDIVTSARNHRKKSGASSKFYSQRSDSRSPDYSCLPKDKIQFILSLKEELKKHNTIPSDFNKLGFFEEVSKLLVDEVWEIRNEATLLILDLVPYLKSDLDSCMSLILPNLIPNLGDRHTRLQKSTLRLLTTYTASTKNKSKLVDDIVAYGLNHKSRRVSKQATLNTIHLLSSDLEASDLTSLTQALYRKVKDEEMNTVALPTLSAVRSLIGRDDLNSQLSMSSKSLEGLDRLLDRVDNSEEHWRTVKNGEDAGSDDDDVVLLRRSGQTRHQLEFGMVDAAVMVKLRHSDWKIRSEGCEELRSELKSLENASPILPHIPDFIELLDTLLSDNNFRISLTVLEMYRMLVGMLGSNLPHHLDQMLRSLLRSVGDSKVVVRIETMRVFKKLLQAATPSAVVSILFKNLNHRSSRIREDCINLIIYALMTFPSYEFDLDQLADWVSGSVADPRRRVRQAALECLAAIAQFLGPSKIGPLMASIDKVEDEEDAEGAMAAVQARLARRLLPRVTPDGLIEYALVVPAPGRNNLSHPKGADVDWILAATGGTSTGSNFSSSGHHLSLSGSSAVLSASFTASDSYVNNLASYTHPQSSPTNSARDGESGLHRKRSLSDVALNKSDERGGLALWTTDTIDLSKTAPSDLGGYRGVYLGKLRQGSSIPRSVTVEKGYSLLPNKYNGNGGGMGSARGERSGSRSPSMPRRINALAPLEQGDGSLVTVARVGSTRSIIPPLSAARAHHSDLEDEVEEDDTEYYVYEEDEDADEEVEEEDEEERDDGRDDEGRMSRPKSSATTRDSGISVFSATEAEVVTENGRGFDRRGNGIRDRRATIHTKGSSSSLTSSVGSTDEPPRNSYDGVVRGRRAGEIVSPSAHSLPSEATRTTGLSLVGKGLNGSGGGGRHRKTPGTGTERDFKNFEYESDFETDDEDPHNITLSNTTLIKMKQLKKKRENLRDIERRRIERETRRAQEERARKYKQLELQHSQNSLQPSRADSGDARLSVQPSVSYRGRSNKSSPHPSPRRAMKPSPSPSPRPTPAPSPPLPNTRIPKSKSHSSNLTQDQGRVNVEKRHRSLERNTSQNNGITQRAAFRTPQLVKRGQAPGRSPPSYTNNRTTTNPKERVMDTQERISRSKNTTPLKSKFSGVASKTATPQKHATPHKNPTPPDRVRFSTITPPEKPHPQMVKATRPLPKSQPHPESRAESRASVDLAMSVGLRSSKPASSCFKSQLSAFSHPNDALRNAHENLTSGEWESQVEGIESIVRLTKHHPALIQGDLKNVNLALLKHAKNLRSQVSRAAIQAFTQLYDTMKRTMESDSEKIVSVLLNRTADTNKFLQLDSHHALDALVENISPTKAVPIIVQEGVGHRNAAVRTSVARLLAYAVERMGGSKALSGQKDVTDKLLPAAVKLAQEGSLETRQYAKQIFQLLIQQGNFDAALKKYVSASEIKNIQKFLDNLTSEGRTIHESARSKYASGSRFTRTM